MLSNNKFLGKCWYGRHPWIRLAVECESMVEKEVNFVSVWEPPMIYLAWKVLGTTRLFSLAGKACLPKKFISIFFALSSDTSTNPYFPARRAFLLLYAIFIFESPSSLTKHQLWGTTILLEHWVLLICECVS